LRLLDGDEDGGLAIFVDEVEVDFASEQKRSQLASVLQIVVEVGKEDVKEVRSVLI